MQDGEGTEGVGPRRGHRGGRAQDHTGGPEEEEEEEEEGGREEEQKEKSKNHSQRFGNKRCSKTLSFFSKAIVVESTHFVE